MSNSQNQVAIRTSFDGVVSFNVRVGKDGTAVQEMTTEGAIFKGGAALLAVKDMSLDSALAKAADGKYRAASDIICAAFPRVAKAFGALCGVNALPWADKAKMTVLIEGAENAEVKPGKAGKPSKQEMARDLIRAMRNLPAFRKESAVIEVVATETTA